MLAVVAAAHIVPILSGALLAVGARKGKKLLLIPWLVVNLGLWDRESECISQKMRRNHGPLSRLISVKVTLLMLLSFSIGVIFLEARLYSVGSTVFGLLSVAALFIGKFRRVGTWQRLRFNRLRRLGKYNR